MATDTRDEPSTRSAAARSRLPSASTVAGPAVNRVRSAYSCSPASAPSSCAGPPSSAPRRRTKPSTCSTPSCTARASRSRSRIAASDATARRVRSAERRSTVDANPTVRLASRISWMSLSSVATCADTARSTAAITSPPTRPPRTPNASAQASAARGVQIEPITGASAAIWAGVCSSGRGRHHRDRHHEVGHRRGPPRGLHQVEVGRGGGPGRHHAEHDHDADRVGVVAEPVERHRDRADQREAAVDQQPAPQRLQRPVDRADPRVAHHECLLGWARGSDRGRDGGRRARAAILARRARQRLRRTTRAGCP